MFIVQKTSKKAQRACSSLPRYHKTDYLQGQADGRDLGWVDLDIYVLSSCPPPQHILSTFQLPKQNEAGSGMQEVDVTPT